MKRTFLMIACACAIFNVLSGCDSFYHPIEKDAVMVKAIPKGPDADSADYSPTLSQDTVTNLSLSGVNKIYHFNLTSDQVRIGIYSMTQKELNSLLTAMKENNKNYENFKAAGEVEKRALERLGKRISRLTDGITFVSLQVKTEPSRFEVLMNPKNGQIESIMQREAVYHSDTDGISAGEVFRKVGTYLEQIQGTTELFQLDYQYAYGSIEEFYFQSHEADASVIGITVDMKSGKLIGFDKDHMSRLWYYNHE
ncbi:hypothetical protein P9847_04475 [Paenibacillus chibensis]|uniref:Uncharacterized protein n=1 Tax=Paenibacillus chibensis TaxID=59846 RepID=A0ABU6PNV3_9BACL|nr:hypothetical protein [Paenibacillus chibensis]